MQAKLPSIRERMARSLIGLALVWVALAAGLNWLAISHEVDELLDDTLSASATVLAGLLSTRAGVEAPLAGPRQALAGDGEFAWQLVDEQGAVLQRSAHAPTGPFLPRNALGFNDAQGWRVLGVAFGPNAQVLYVAQTRAERREARIEVLVDTSWAALLAGALGYGWMRWRVRRELAPVDTLSDAVKRYDPLAPAATVGPPERAEFAPVHAAIDALGARLALQVAHERALSAHAAHALRTPLAGLDAQLAVAQREAPASLVPRLQRAREATARLQRVLAALLALFRGERALVREPVDLAALLERLPVSGLSLHCPGAARLDADPDLLSAALINLIDNALRHGAHAIHVEAADAHHLRLHDDGPGVSPERRSEIEAALAQADDGQPGAIGLGLRLADLVARSHGGRLTLPAVEQGFAVELTFGPG